MTRWERIRANGLSLETANRLMLAFVIIVSATLTITMLRTYRQFRELSEATERYIEMQDAADDLRDASDYLTEKVQRFTSSGDPSQMEDYFEEVLTTRRREKAVAIMRREQPDSQALVDLEEAMAQSVALSERELYAMRLVVEAKGCRTVPRRWRTCPSLRLTPPSPPPPSGIWPGIWFMTMPIFSPRSRSGRAWSTVW